MDITAPPDPVPEIMTVKQAAEFLQVSPDVLYQMLPRKEIPGRKVKGQWRLVRGVLIEWLRGAYTTRAGAPSTQQEGACLIEEKEVGTGGSLSTEYDNLLRRKTSRTQKLSKAA